MTEGSLLASRDYRGTKSDLAYNAVRAAILAGRLEPGTTLNQQVLAAQVGVSITPPREALRRLQADGPVGFEAHRTVRVLPLTAREFRELFEVKLQLDPYAAGLVANEATDEQIEIMRSYAGGAGVRSVAERLDSHRRFHGYLLAASGNEVLASTCMQVWIRSDRYRAIILREDSVPLGVPGHQHAEIAEAVAARRATLAARLARAHVIEAQDAIARSSQLTDI